MARLLILILCFLSTTVYSQDQSALQQISSYVDQQQSSQLALLEKLVNINSGTTNTEGVRAVAKVLLPIFNQLGFKTRLVDEPASMHRGPTLIAERNGTKGKRILLIGHLDTVFNKKSPFQKYSVKGERAFGPGVVDDKGGDVVIIYALKALQAAHALDNTSIRVVLTGDEEDSGKPTSISRKPLVEVARNSDIALDFECAITKDTATIGRRGISMWTITSQGVEAHSAEIFKSNVGYGAIYEVSRILNSLRERFAKEHSISLNPGLILGGTQMQYEKNDSQGKAQGKQNVIAKQALATGDMRFSSEAQQQEIMHSMQNIVGQSLDKTHSEISFQAGIPAMSPTEANLNLLQQYSKVSQDLGFGPIKPLPPHVRGAGDISHIAAMVSANLAGLGPMGADIHAIKESLDIHSLPMQTKRAAWLIYQLTR